MVAALSSNLSDPDAIPYFLWDTPMTVSQLKEFLEHASSVERIRMLAKLLREARDTDVWHFTRPEEIVRFWPLLVRHLGRRRAFWEFLLNQWREAGLVQFG